MSNIIDYNHDCPLETEYESFCLQVKTTEMILNHLEHLRNQEMQPKHALFINRMIREQHEKREFQTLQLQNLKNQIKK